MTEPTRPPMPLATSSYSAFHPEMGLPVRITVGRPKFVSYPYVDLTVLAPWELFRGGRYVEQPVEDERRIYRHRLHRYQHRIVRDLTELGQMYAGQTGILLCYEDVNAGQICHRRWFAEWAEQRWGWEIPEIGS